MRRTVRNLANCFPTAIVSGRCREKVYKFSNNTILLVIIIYILKLIIIMMILVRFIIS